MFWADGGKIIEHLSFSDTNLTERESYRERTCPCLLSCAMTYALRVSLSRSLHLQCRFSLGLSVCHPPLYVSVSHWITLFSNARLLHVFSSSVHARRLSRCADVLEISTDLLKQAYEMQVLDYTRFLKSTRLFSMMSEAQVIHGQTRSTN